MSSLPPSSVRPATILRVLLFLLTGVGSAPAGENLRDHLLVVYNTAAAESEALARYYAEKRGIPAERIIAVTCPEEEEIDRATFQRTLQEPLAALFEKNRWTTRESVEVPSAMPGGRRKLLAATSNEVWAICLMRGVPLKIRHQPDLVDDKAPRPEFATNAAAVDSELALLPILGAPVTGVLRNPFYDEGVGHEFDAFDARRLILVTRLDGPTAVDVRRMIDGALQAERTRLAGCAYVDTRNFHDPQSGYFIGDEWLRHATAQLTQLGWPVEMDRKPELFPENLPWTNVAIYLGWYEGQGQGPFMHAPRRFVPGAIAYHIHSFSAMSIRTTTGYWVGPLISAGAACTMGCVYEPYLDLTPHVDIFMKRLLAGATFAEAAYASQKALSWMTTVVGDPLYRPFAQPLDAALTTSAKLAAAGELSNFDWLLLQTIRMKLATGVLTPSAASLGDQLVQPGVGGAMWEGYGDILRALSTDPAHEPIGAAYLRAYKMSNGAEDQIRIGLKAARTLAPTDKEDPGMKILNELWVHWPRESLVYQVPVNREAMMKREPPPMQEAVLVPPAALPEVARDPLLNSTPPPGPAAPSSPMAPKDLPSSSTSPGFEEKKAKTTP